MNDFLSLPKIDAHIHYNHSRDLVCNLGKKYGFRYLTINTEVPFFPSVDHQRDIALKIQARHSSILDFIGTFRTLGWELQTWSDQAKMEITESLNSGARGIKIWKNIGMMQKDRAGNMIMIDHPQYHMYRHPEFPSYDDQIRARDRMLDKHPGLRFIGEQELADKLTSRWLDHWNFFNTDKLLQSGDFTGVFRGLNLSQNILEKIYHKNAVNWFGL